MVTSQGSNTLYKEATPAKVQKVSGNLGNIVMAIAKPHLLGSGEVRQHSHTRVPNREAPTFSTLNKSVNLPLLTT